MKLSKRPSKNLGIPLQIKQTELEVAIFQKFEKWKAKGRI